MRSATFSLFILGILVFLFPSASRGEDFIAQSVGDYGNVAVMEVSGSYDADIPGSKKDIPRQVIAKEFFRTHKDEYDFLIVFSNFDFEMPEPEAEAFYLRIKNDVRGIGVEIRDYTTLFGSEGKLQGMIDMGNVSKYVTDPEDPNFEQSLFILSHELMHRWGAHVRFRDGDGTASKALLSGDQNHWSFLFDSGASVLYGNSWQMRGEGAFTSIAAGKHFGPLDLYLMGLYDRTKVPPMLLIDNPSIDDSTPPKTGMTIAGTPRWVTIDDIIAVEGEREPDASVSRKTFKAAFIFITRPGTFSGYELNGLENVRNGWETGFPILTKGLGLMEVALLPRENIPSSFGVRPFFSELSDTAPDAAEPDLSVKDDDIMFSPALVSMIPTDVVVSAMIRNDGRTEVPQARIVLFDRLPFKDRIVSETQTGVPGQSSVQVSFKVRITDGNPHRFYVSIDPQNLVKESNKSNNLGAKTLYPEITCDFEILSSDISISSNPANILDDVKITAIVTNRGTTNAYNVQLRYSINAPGNRLDLATVSADIPAGRAISREITWRANRAGENLPITVYVDPFDSFQELSESNNKAVIYLTVRGSI